jgi:hypothetical protein
MLGFGEEKEVGEFTVEDAEEGVEDGVVEGNETDVGPVEAKKEMNGEAATTHDDKRSSDSPCHS